MNEDQAKWEDGVLKVISDALICEWTTTSDVMEELEKYGSWTYELGDPLDWEIDTEMMEEIAASDFFNDEVVSGSDPQRGPNLTVTLKEGWRGRRQS